MISSRSRPVAGILSIILLVALIYLLSVLSSQQDRNTQHHLNLVASAIFAFNIPALLCWIAFGIEGGIAVTLFSVLAIIFFDLRMGLYGYHIMTLPLLATGVIGYVFLRIKEDMDQSYQLRNEKSEEEINMLTSGFREKNLSIQSLEEKLVRYSLLKGVSESLSMALALDDVNKLIVRESVAIIGKRGRTLLFLVDPDRQDLMLSAAHDESRVKTKKGDAFDHWILRNRKALIIEDVTKDYRFSASDVEAARPYFRSLIAQPLISENKVIGILRMDSLHPFEYTQDDLRLLDIISDLGAVAVQNALLYSRTQELAIRDGLTGLVVRRYFMERFHNEVKRSARKKDSLSLVIMDIDHFKDYNDKYGHAAGDLVLVHMAKMIRRMVDEADVVGRYGGEEIVVLFCGKSKKEAVAEAEKIRNAIKDAPLMLRRQKTQLTVSMGLAAYPEDDISEKELMRIADARLYRAKSEGRDRVCSN